jgi:hypothetical protein
MKRLRYCLQARSDSLRAGIIDLEQHDVGIPAIPHANAGRASSAQYLVDGAGPACGRLIERDMPTMLPSPAAKFAASWSLK